MDHQAAAVARIRVLHEPDVQFRGFYELYQIDKRKPDDHAGKKKQSDRATKAKGLNSPFGQRGAICAHYGWMTWDMLHWGIKWNIVQRAMVDAPYFETDEDEGSVKSGDKVTAVTPENAESLMNWINSMNG